MMSPANKIKNFYNKLDSRALSKLIFESSRWRIYYKRAFGLGVIFSILLHLVVIGWIFFFSEKQDPKLKSVKIKTYYEKIAPPIKYEPTPPKLAKSFELLKEQQAATEYQPKDYSLKENVDVNELRTEMRPNMTSSAGAGQGSVFHGSITSTETGGAEGWSIPGGTKSYGRSLGRGGTGGIFGRDDGGLGDNPNILSEIVNTRTSQRGSEMLKDQLIDYTNFQDRFEAFVTQGKNKKDIKGFLNFYQLYYRASKLSDNGEPAWNSVALAPPALVEYAESKTKLDVRLKGSIRLDDKLLMEVPMLYMMGSDAAPLYSNVEVKNLEKYLRNGGFLFIDDGYATIRGPFNQKVRQLIEEALGYDAEWEKIPNNHWLYHCWEDFAGPPPGEDEVRPNPNHDVKERYKYLEGVFLNGRLVVLLSSKGYCKAWGDWPRNPPSLGGPLDNTRQLQFGLNVVVFACTQKGGIIDRINQQLASENK
jgi:hypothetical protein